MTSSKGKAQRPPPLRINPPLLNTANPWATTLKDLQKLYDCPYTGAVTTRTSLIKGFEDDPAVHKYVLYDTVGGHESGALPKGTNNASFNSLGYSPIVLSEYLSFIKTISAQLATPEKGFIVSVTGTPREVAECYYMVVETQKEVRIPLAVEVNLSCPNIPDKPPPAYDGPSILEYIDWLNDPDPHSRERPRIPLGIKTPPYTYSTQYATMINALIASASRSPAGVCPVSFITATNTLGSCLMVSSPSPSSVVPGSQTLTASKPSTPKPVLPGSGIGGMAGTPLHPLALGNVATIRRLLDEHEEMLGHIQIIGVGGVCDAGGYRRMRSVGAYAVGVATGLGIKGLGVFEEIGKAVKDSLVS